MEEALERDVRRMLDEHAIRRMIMSYGRAVDRLDREMLASFFHPDAVEHHGTYDGPARDFVAHAIDHALPRFTTTTHYVVNCLVDVDGDEATAESGLIAAHVRGEPGSESVDWMHARLLDRLVRYEATWKIMERTVVHDWDMTEPIERVVGWEGVFTRGTRDRDDPSYTLRSSRR